MSKSKTRHREYMDSILYSKTRLKVNNDYSPFMVNQALRPHWEDNIHVLSMVNTNGVSMIEGDISEQRLHQKQMHYDFLLNILPKQIRK